MSANNDPKDARLRSAHLLREAGFVTLAHELEHGSLASLGPTEPVFVLCGRDRLAPWRVHEQKAVIEAGTAGGGLLLAIIVWGHELGFRAGLQSAFNRMRGQSNADRTGRRRKTS